MKLSDRLKELRTVHDLTLKEVQASTGIDYVRLSRYENGQGNPTTKTLRKLCTLYGLTLSELMDGVS